MWIGVSGIETGCSGGVILMTSSKKCREQVVGEKNIVVGN